MNARAATDRFASRSNVGNAKSIWTTAVPDKLMSSDNLITDDLARQGFWEPGIESEALDLVGTLSCVEETAYVWDFASDKIEWEGNAAEVLHIESLDEVGTGQDFNALIAAEHIGRRLEAVRVSKFPAA